MAKAVKAPTTFRRRPEDAATIAIMLLKAAVLGPDHGMAPATVQPRRPVLAGGVAAKVREGV